MFFVAVVLLKEMVVPSASKYHLTHGDDVDHRQLRSIVGLALQGGVLVVDADVNCWFS
jgi:hypothetical protein